MLIFKNNIPRGYSKAPRSMHHDRWCPSSIALNMRVAQIAHVAVLTQSCSLPLLADCE
jgi:hypothetical protein